MSGVPPVDSDALLDRCRRGDQAAFRQLFAIHSPSVLRLIGRMLGRYGDTEDILQEVFLQVYRSLKDFRGDSKISTWIHRITVNVVLMARRSHRSRPASAAVALDDTLHDEKPWPDEEAACQRRLLAFQRCIDSLPEKKRVVFLLHEIEGLPAAEIAEIVDAPILTVRTRLFYARQELAELMRREPVLVALLEQKDARGLLSLHEKTGEPPSSRNPKPTRS